MHTMVLSLRRSIWGSTRPKHITSTVHCPLLVLPLLSSLQEQATTVSQSISYVSPRRACLTKDLHSTLFLSQSRLSIAVRSSLSRALNQSCTGRRRRSVMVHVQWILCGVVTTDLTTASIRRSEHSGGSHFGLQSVSGTSRWICLCGKIGKLSPLFSLTLLLTLLPDLLPERKCMRFKCSVYWITTSCRVSRFHCCRNTSTLYSGPRRRMT